jgi:hypothetical protein
MAVEPLSVGKAICGKDLRRVARVFFTFSNRVLQFWGNLRKKPRSAGFVLEIKKFLIAVFQRVPNGNPKSLHARAAEFKIVAHKVEVSFRPDEDGVSYIKAESAANVGKEVVTALEIGTTDKVTCEKWLIKAQAFQTDPGLQFRLGPLAKRRPIDCIEIVENRAVGIEKDINVLMATPGHLATDSEILLDKEKIAAESWITTPADALRSVICACKGI